jgi:hypothetical protein
MKQVVPEGSLFPEHRLVVTVKDLSHCCFLPWSIASSHQPDVRQLEVLHGEGGVRRSEIHARALQLPEAAHVDLLMPYPAEVDPRYSTTVLFVAAPLRVAESLLDVFRTNNDAFHIPRVEDKWLRTQGTRLVGIAVLDELVILYNLGRRLLGDGLDTLVVLGCRTFSTGGLAHG